MKFRTLTNVRPSKDLGCQITAAPTNGQFKITPEAVKAIGVTAGDYLGLTIDEETGTIYAYRGENGDGGKLAASNKGGGGVLTFSAANAWEEIGGDTDHNTNFDVSETPVEFEDVMYFPLTSAGQTDKQVRKSKGEKDVSEDVSEEKVSEEIIAEEVVAEDAPDTDFENM